MNVFEKIFGLEKGLLLENVFAHNCPVFDNKLFYPRKSLFREASQSIKEFGTQLVIYGDPLIGKTMLVINALRYCERNYIRIPCDETMTTSKFLSEVLSNIEKWHLEKRRILVGKNHLFSGNLNFGIGKYEMDSSKKYEQEFTFTHWDNTPSISKIVRSLVNSNMILFIDDVEQVADDNLNISLMALSKQLSDNYNNIDSAKIVLSYASPVRHFIETKFDVVTKRMKLIHIPKMNAEEMRGLINLGLDLSYLRLDESVIDKIILYSEGMPGKAKYYCHQIGLAVANFLKLESHHLPKDSLVVTEDWFNAHVAA